MAVQSLLTVEMDYTSNLFPIKLCSPWLPLTSAVDNYSSYSSSSSTIVIVKTITAAGIIRGYYHHR